MQQKLSFRDSKYANHTEVAKHIWKLKDNKKKYTEQVYHLFSKTLQKYFYTMQAMPNWKTLH